VDSTAVSALLEWRRAATRAKRVIAYVNFPANLKSLIQLYGVTELLVSA
jgi:phospholipid transport system transporter-binding protein